MTARILVVIFVAIIVISSASPSSVVIAPSIDATDSSASITVASAAGYGDDSGCEGAERSALFVSDRGRCRLQIQGQVSTHAQ